LRLGTLAAVHIERQTADNRLHILLARQQRQLGKILIAAAAMNDGKGTNCQL
jgi:hypothetical protein